MSVRPSVPCRQLERAHSIKGQRNLSLSHLLLCSALCSLQLAVYVCRRGIRASFCFRLSGKLVEGNYQKQIDKKKSKTQSEVCICLGPQRSSFLCKAAERTEERAPIHLPKVWQAGRQANASLIRPSLPCSNCSSTWLGINEDASRHNLHSRSRLEFRHDRLHTQSFKSTESHRKVFSRLRELAPAAAADLAT